MSAFLGLGYVNDDDRADLVTITGSSYVGQDCRGVGCQLVYTGRGTGGLAPGVVVDGDWWGLNGAF
ncbi:hypothetical protein [Streptomyces sp. NPDC007264]|uniref:hypothetical protein n=1 Tax=Streptomyces sp. NPDC007264 TaxID=3364777 RepID=UPI0036DBFEC5